MAARRSEERRSLPLFDGIESSPEETRKVFSVSHLTRLIKETLESAFDQVWVSGEVSDIARPQSGHLYFTMKDEHAQIRAVMWRSAAQRLGFDLRDGMEILCLAGMDVYPPRGGYQLIVRRLEPLGVGAQQLALRQLQERLAREGLFAAARKRPLPPFPRRLGLITSPTGAAVRDFLEVLRRRWATTEVLIIPARMQGDGAERDIAAALELANQLTRPLDLLVLARGGGSVEDLQCFNTEGVVRAIVRSRLPVVSAVGHEIDVTLADLAADVRALTPTEAAERVVPSRDELLEHLEQQTHRLRQSLRWRLEQCSARLKRLSERRVLSNPFDLVRAPTRQVDELQIRLMTLIRRQLAATGRQIRHEAERLESLSPLAVLRRGYSVTRRPDGRVVQGFDEVQVGDPLVSLVARGVIHSRVERVEPARQGDGSDGANRGPEHGSDSKSGGGKPE
jgi:exodeoxyribonuclease VII large subunit